MARPSYKAQAEELQAKVAELESKLEAVLASKEPVIDVIPQVESAEETQPSYIFTPDWRTTFGRLYGRYRTARLMILGVPIPLDIQKYTQAVPPPGCQPGTWKKIQDSVNLLAANLNNALIRGHEGYSVETLNIMLAADASHYPQLQAKVPAEALQAYLSVCRDIAEVYIECLYWQSFPQGKKDQYLTHYNKYQQITDPEVDLLEATESSDELDAVPWE